MQPHISVFTQKSIKLEIIARDKYSVASFKVSYHEEYRAPRRPVLALGAQTFLLITVNKQLLEVLNQFSCLGGVVTSNVSVEPRFSRSITKTQAHSVQVGRKGVGRHKLVCKH